jgi:sec-independent protein translocase protein TatA
VIGTPEIVVILLLALILLGPKKLPEIGNSLVSAMRELRKASNEFMSVVDNDDEDRQIRTPKAIQSVPEYEEQAKAEHTSQDETIQSKGGE